MKEARGCYEEGTYLTLLGDEKLPRCPLIFVRDNRGVFNDLIRGYRFLQKGLLPEAGGTGDQAATFMEAMAVIDRAVQEVEAELRKRPSRAPGAAG